MASWGRALATSFSVFGLAAGCSVFTSLDGFSGGAVPGAPGDAGGTPDAPGDGTTGTPDAISTKPRAWRQLTVKGPPPLHSARMAYDEARSKAILFGGGDPSAKNDTWEWDGTAWSLRTLSASPTPRLAPGFAYDSARHLIMLFAGQGATPDPWQWDGGAEWKSSGVSPSSPDITSSAAMTYDRVRNVLVMFGGIGSAAGNPDTRETWEWSASGGFAKRTPAVSPPARHAHVMVYDSARSRVVLFGGNNGTTLSDVWEYDGTTWAERTPPLSPPGRKGACGAYDSNRKVTIVFGGRPDDNTKALSDTWEWDGTTWRQGPSGPTQRASCAMTFDVAHDMAVMFGGSLRRVGKNPPVLADDITWVYE